jgi:hypothetical protein
MYQWRGSVLFAEATRNNRIFRSNKETTKTFEKVSPVKTIKKKKVPKEGIDDDDGDDDDDEVTAEDYIPFDQLIKEVSPEEKEMLRQKAHQLMGIADPQVKEKINPVRIIDEKLKKLKEERSHGELISDDNYFLEKFNSLSKNEVSIYNLLLEIRSKKVPIKLTTIQAILLAQTRLKENQLLAPSQYNNILSKSLQVYLTLLKEGPELLLKEIVVDTKEKDHRGRLRTVKTVSFVSIDQQRNSDKNNKNINNTSNNANSEELREFFYSFLRNIYQSEFLTSESVQEMEKLILSSGFLPSVSFCTSSDSRNNTSSSVIVGDNNSDDPHFTLIRLLGDLARLNSSSSSVIPLVLNERVHSFILSLLSDSRYNSSSNSSSGCLLSYYSIHEMNDLLRVLGKFGFLREVFLLFHRLKEIQPFIKYRSVFLSSAELKPFWRDFSKLAINAETIEYLVNSMILQVVREEKSLAMKELPPMKQSQPEVSYSIAFSIFV